MTLNPPDEIQTNINHVKNTGYDKMGSSWIRPSNLGPSFIFEFNKMRIFDEIYKALHESFGKYSGFDIEKPEEYKVIKEHMFADGVISESLNSNLFDRSKLKEATITLYFIDHENIRFDEEYKNWLNDMYGKLRNEPTYEYLCIDSYKGRKEFLYSPEVMEAFHKNMIIWINTLNPYFVWGDNFTTIKKYENEDSRFRIWAYNYYSEELVNAIGIERFRQLVNETKGWNIQEYNNGIILVGLSEPRAIRESNRLKAKKILQLDQALSPIVGRKPHS